VEEASWRRHHGGGIREEASRRRHQGGGIREEASWRRRHWEALWKRHHGDGVREEDIMEKAAGRRHHGGGILEEPSWRRHHGGGIMEEASWRREASWRNILETSGRHLRIIKDAIGTHPGGPWRFLGQLWGPRVFRTIWGVLGVSAHKMLTILNPFELFTKSVNFTVCA
jgi:hypothetical protein